jgi:solute:Na+ symporter, SSS family
MIVGIVAAMAIGCNARGDYIIARATAIFFGLCASAFLPAFIGGLYFRGVTRAAVKASMVTGFFVAAFWGCSLRMPRPRRWASVTLCSA